MTTSGRSPALAAIGAILVITAAWWGLALWPTEPSAPTWLLRTRAVCFGASATGLPDAGGWTLLIGQPLGMLIVLITVWPAECRAALARLVESVGGQMLVGTVAAAIVAGLGGVALRVVNAGSEPFLTTPDGDVSGSLTRVNDRPPAFALLDQHGHTVTLDQFSGRPVIVTFAFAHCETVCPTVVSQALEAQASLEGRDVAVLILTLDPWRDTPARLAAMADAWRVTGDTRVLSGPVDEVERALNAWRIPRVRNERTGDLSHPSLVYVIDARGRIAYVVGGSAGAIRAAVRAL